jgi:hypothetical protein
MKWRMPWTVLKAPFPDPGAMNGVLHVNTELVNYDLRGQGRKVNMQLQTFFRPIVVSNVQVPYGYGGLVQGQLVQQPLSTVNPSNNQSAQDLSSSGIIS